MGNALYLDMVENGPLKSIVQLWGEENTLCWVTNVEPETPVFILFALVSIPHSRAERLFGTKVL